MKIFFAALFSIVLVASGFAQKPDDILATVGSKQVKLADLSKESQEAVTSLPTRLFATRSAVLDQMVNQRLLDAEAKATGSSTGKLLAAEKAKVANPAEPEIKAIYDANREALGDLTLEKARKQIVGYLRREPEQKVLGALISRLKAKYKFTAGKPVNSPNLLPTDVIATVNGQALTAKEYEEKAAVAIYELNSAVSELVLEDINQTLYNAMIAEEATAEKIDASSLIAREITNKMKDYSDEERFALQDAFGKKLVAKFKPVINYKAPTPIVQQISADDDPSIGPADAPVTIVMFSDFECPACAAAHPVLKKVIESFLGKVRFVVRDYPLESIHENAFAAARGANAAHAQGKFFEYSELLYKRQGTFDNASLMKYATEIGLNVKQFEIDFNAEKNAAEIRKDQADGDAYIVNSTPTIFVNGIRVRELSDASFRGAIDAALAKKN